MNNKRIKILIGDDAPLHLDSVVLGLWQKSSKERKKPIRTEREGDLIVFNYVPLGEEYSLVFKVVSTVEEMIEEGKKPYDWKVTDMRYGEGREEGGVEVVKAVQPYRKEGEVLVVCTTEENKRALQEVQRLGIDYLVTQSSFLKHKLTLLGEAMAEHYKLGGK